MRRFRGTAGMLDGIFADASGDGVPPARAGPERRKILIDPQLTLLRHAEPAQKSVPSIARSEQTHLPSPYRPCVSAAIISAAFGRGANAAQCVGFRLRTRHAINGAAFGILPIVNPRISYWPSCPTPFCPHASE